MNSPTNIFTRYWYFLIVVLIGLLALVIWTNYRFALHNPGGSDFIPAWVGTRHYLSEGESPYGEAVKLEVQERFYGHPAGPGEDVIPFVYPFYSMIVFAPFAIIPDYELARAFWMLVLEVSLVVTAILSLSVVRWRPPKGALVVFLIFSILWYFGWRAVINGNVVVLVSLFVVLGFWFLRSERDFAAGVFFSLATITPNVVVLLLPFLLLWALTCRRWNLIGGLISSLGVLVVTSFIFFPGWLLENLVEVLNYANYPTPTSPGEAFKLWWPGVGTNLGWGLTIFLALLLLFEWLAALGKDFRWFLWTACLTLLTTQWIGIATDPGNFVILFLPLVLVFSTWVERWGNTGNILAILSMIALFALHWGLFIQTLTFTDQPVQNPVLFFPLPLFLFIMMYWIRWWAITPYRLFIDSLRDFDNRFNR